MCSITLLFNKNRTYAPFKFSDHMLCFICFVAVNRRDFTTGYWALSPSSVASSLSSASSSPCSSSAPSGSKGDCLLLLLLAGSSPSQSCFARLVVWFKNMKRSKVFILRSGTRIYSDNYRQFGRLIFECCNCILNM